MEKDKKPDSPDEKELVKQHAMLIEKTLESFDIPIQIVEAHIEPEYFEYRAQVAIGHKITDILALEKDIAFALASPTGKVEMTAPIPGTCLLGIKVPKTSKAKTSTPTEHYKTLRIEVKTPAPSIIDQIRTGLFKLLLFISNLFARSAYWLKPTKG